MNSELVKIPKIELHMHIDGSISFSLLEKWSGLSHEEVFKEVVSQNDVSLEDYLEHFNFINNYLQTKENLELACYTLGRELERENVIYAEARFAPLIHTREGLTPEEVIDSVLKGFSKCNVKVNLILCMIRGMDYSYNKTVIELAMKYLGKGVVAVDLAGGEAANPFKDYEELFLECNKLGIPYTIHSGEVTERDIKDVVLYTKRIGHGIKICDDPELINLIKENNILLEVCPNSNLDTHNATDYSHHPIKKLYDMGIKVSVNTDNRTVSNICLTKEYEYLMHYLDFKIDDFYQMNLNAIQYAFIGESEKEYLRKKLLEKKESHL